MKIIDIEPRPKDDEAAAIAAALARVYSARMHPPRESDRWRHVRELKQAGLIPRAALEYYVDVSWQEAAQFEALDAGV